MLGWVQSEPTPGKLFLVGGGRTPDAVGRAFVEAAGGPKAVVVVLAQVREDPERGARASMEFLTELGAGRVFSIPDRSFSRNRLAEISDQFKEVTGVWVPGGDQELFMDRWGIDWLHQNFRAMFRRGVHFYGTSAGAMILSNPMIAGPGDRTGTVRMRSGVGLTRLTIDTHYRERRREDRLLDALRQSPSSEGLGLSESGWVILHNEKIIERQGTVDVVSEPRTELAWPYSP
ncbi:MAG TPA: Type 1 glutamine amidotransferase-like domain-containing protein [Fimbriimonadaceae bacterium]|nr:Type 1 glutamine amidotransferase-like domain-containing protein [Fimbriimonadaceae bacterium]